MKAPKVTEPEPPRGGRTVNSLVQSSRGGASPVARLSDSSKGVVCTEGVLLEEHEIGWTRGAEQQLSP